MNETTLQSLYSGILQLAESSSPFSAGANRRDGLEAFRKLGLPGGKSEEYRFTPLTKNLEKNFKPEDFYGVAPFSALSIDPFLIPGYESNVLVFTNGKYNESLSSIISPANQFTVTPLVGALTNDPVAAGYFDHLAPSSNDPFTALNTALWLDGVFINVPENTKVEKPVFVLHLSDSSEKNTVNQTRLLLVVGKGSEITITEKFNSVGSHSVFTSTVEEFEVKESATLNYHRLQNDGGAVYQTGSTQIRQHDKSRVNTFTLLLDGQVVRNNLGITVDGEGCESHFNGLYLLHKNTIADNHTVVDHIKPNSFSNELYKGIMDGHSKGVFNGKIYVRPHAQKTNAFQSNRNILLSETSTVNTKPQLEIWADDVKCSHGCTSGQLDEEALFYLQSRGISKHTARAMVLYAFAAEVVAPVKDPVLKGYFDNLISERLQKSI